MDQVRHATAAGGVNGRLMAAGLTIMAALWTLVIVAVPSVGPGRSPLFSALAYQVGSHVCHQRPDRSFHPGGTQMPVCARCFGLYAGGAAGLILAWGGRRRLASAAMRSALLAGAAPIAVTVGLEWLSLIETSNAVRWATGMPAGLVAGLTIAGLLSGPD